MFSLSYSMFSIVNRDVFCRSSSGVTIVLLYAVCCDRSVGSPSSIHRTKVRQKAAYSNQVGELLPASSLVPGNYLPRRMLECASNATESETVNVHNQPIYNLINLTARTRGCSRCIGTTYLSHRCNI